MSPDSLTSPPKTVSLYETAVKIHPRSVSGRYNRLRVAATCTLLGLYYLIPWLQWQGRPLVLFDLPARRFHIFTLTLVPQDLLLLALLLLLAALTLFLVTSLAGRLWCGYACPQTVWTNTFLWMERLCEGDRYAQIKLDRAPWGPNKLARKGAKHLLWAAFALLTGLTFVSYFVPARELIPQALHFQLGGWALFWTGMYGFATWGNAGFMREQVCKYMCPYARFQSAMFDRDTLIIAYDEGRGEPRKSLAKQIGRAAGDCTDCTLCVQVCPTGIDIRKGLQYECIACAACVDACDSVMDSVAKPRGLIRYTSSAHEAGAPFRFLRGRTLGYGAVWLAASAAFVTLVLLHSTLRFDVLRDRHTLYREMSDGSIENLYQLKISNDDGVPHTYLVRAHFSDGAPLTVEPDRLTRDAHSAAASPVMLRTAAQDVSADGHPQSVAVRDVVIELEQQDAPDIRRSRSARFLTGEHS